MGNCVVGVSDTPFANFRYEREIPDGVDSEFVRARIAFEGVFAFFGNFCEPLSMDVVVSYWDRELDYPDVASYPPAPFWLLRKRDLPPDVTVGDAWEGQLGVLVDLLTIDAAARLVDKVLAENLPEAGKGDVGWREIEFRALAARLPEDFDVMSGGGLDVALGSSIFKCPVEERRDGKWVSGPRSSKSLDAPMRVRVSKELGVLSCEISVYWSLWTSGEPGGLDVRHGLERLLACGWSAANE